MTVQRLIGEDKGLMMQVTETLNSGLKREIKVVVPASDMEAKLAARLSDAQGKARINGFRPGKVPMQHLRKMYGKSFMAEVVNEILNDSRTIITGRGEKAAMQPEVIMTEDEKEAEKILAGGVARALDMLGPKVQRALDRQLPPHLRGVPLRAAHFGSSAGLVGAAFAGAAGSDWRSLA